MALFIIARFHAKAGAAADVQAAILANLEPTRAESGCRSIGAFRSIRDPRLFFIHSSFDDVVAFELHATLPHTIRFLARVEPLIDHPLDVNRLETIG